MMDHDLPADFYTIRPSTPSAGGGHSKSSSLSAVMGCHLPSPYSNSKGGRCLSHLGREGDSCGQLRTAVGRPALYPIPRHRLVLSKNWIGDYGLPRRHWKYPVFIGKFLTQQSSPQAINNSPWTGSPLSRLVSDSVLVCGFSLPTAPSGATAAEMFASLQLNCEFRSTSSGGHGVFGNERCCPWPCRPATRIRALFSYHLWERLYPALRGQAGREGRDRMSARDFFKHNCAGAVRNLSST